MKVGLRTLFPRQRVPAVAVATANPDVLRALWARAETVQVREARTTAGLYALLERSQLVILDADDVLEVDVDLDQVRDVLERTQVPHCDSATFLADPDDWLKQAAAFWGDLRSLPPRLVTLTSLASGGVGKTTLSLNLAFTVSKRLPVAVVELTHASSGFLSVLDEEHFTAKPLDAYTIISQAEEPARWKNGRGEIAVIPMDGRHAHLVGVGDFQDFMLRLRRRYSLTIVDAVQPHPLWEAVRMTADYIFVVASAQRTDTIANAQILVDELGDDPRVWTVMNMATAMDRLAGRLARTANMVTITERESIARYEDRVPELISRIWPGVRL